MTTLIPYLFLRNRVNLSWSDALWGYERQMIGWPVIVDLATDKIGAGSNDPFEIEIAGIQKGENHQVGELLRKLASLEHRTDKKLSQHKWLYLNLAWILENKANILDPLAEVETIYANFDYPKEIEGFVRYMPATDGYNPSQHSKSENEQRLFEKWQRYLCDAERQLATSE